jgi:hypothetical protein
LNRTQQGASLPVFIPPSSVHEVLLQRLELLHALADSLGQARAELVTTTPAILDRHTARQRELCRQLHSLGAGSRDGAHSGLHAGLADDLQATSRRVADLNRAYGALLRRRRRTVDIFCRVLANSGTTYAAPKPLSRPGLKGRKPKG